MTHQDVADVGNTEQPMMGGEQGVNNNDNNMPQAPLQADVGNTEQPTMGGEQGGNNNDNNMPQAPLQQTLDEGASSPKSVPRPPSPPPCLATKTPAIHQMIKSYEPKTKSSNVQLLKNEPKRAPTFGKESPNVQVLKQVLDEKYLTRTSFQKQKEEHISMFSSDEVPDKYEHGKPFLFRWQLNEGPSELMRLHGWIMHVMKQGIHTITANVPKWVFNSSLEWKVAINFPDLHAMFRHDKLNINLVTIWSM
jgi:hypothetical protein